MTQIHYVSKKTSYFAMAHIFAKYQPIFIFLFTGTLSRKFAIKWLLNIPPHLNCAATLPRTTLPHKIYKQEKLTEAKFFLKNKRHFKPKSWWHVF